MLSLQSRKWSGLQLCPRTVDNSNSMACDDVVVFVRDAPLPHGGENQAREPLPNRELPDKPQTGQLASRTFLGVTLTKILLNAHD